LEFMICDLFVIWCLEFVILDPKRQGSAKDLCPPHSGIFDGPRGPGFPYKTLLAPHGRLCRMGETDAGCLGGSFQGNGK